jgi:hypothetical protein
MAGRDTMSGWIPLMDYAIKKGISLSTLRRHIKANKIVYRVENGRYLLQDESVPDIRPAVPRSQQLQTSDHSQSFEDSAQVRALRQELQRAREEIAELKTLIAFYEEGPQASLSPRANPPAKSIDG